MKSLDFKNVSISIYINHPVGLCGIKDLKHDLSIRYGPGTILKTIRFSMRLQSFTYPEIRSFFTKYVEGTTPIPYEEFFGYAGVKYSPKRNDGIYALVERHLALIKMAISLC